MPFQHVRFEVLWQKLYVAVPWDRTNSCALQWLFIFCFQFSYFCCFWNPMPYPPAFFMCTLWRFIIWLFFAFASCRCMCIEVDVQTWLVFLDWLRLCSTCRLHVRRSHCEIWKENKEVQSFWIGFTCPICLCLGHRNPHSEILHFVLCCLFIGSI